MWSIQAGDIIGLFSTREQKRSDVLWVKVSDLAQEGGGVEVFFILVVLLAVIEVQCSAQFF